MTHTLSRRRFALGLSAAGISTVFSSRLVGLAQEATPSPGFSAPAPLPAIGERASGPLNVVASTSIIADLARQVGGERVNVTSILPANVDPHDFEPNPDDVITLEGADILLLHGLQLDSWVEPLIDASSSAAPVIVVTTGIETISGGDHDDHDHEDEDHEHEDDEHEDDDRGDDDHDHDLSEGDPHVWFDPMRVKTMVANIRDGLISVDPEGETGYQTRADAYSASLDQLDAEIRALIDTIPSERRIMVTNHDALGYFAERYGLTVVGTVIPGLDTRTEPSAKDIAELIEAIKESGATVIFAENTVSPALAESLASDAGIRVAPDLYTDSLGDADSGADTYIGLMQTDTLIIVENLRA
ncbi:MAG: zinc ABC transporter substrate-binding protein [Thermomicrobiales bacterium]|nr:zinc ABC transporter substrate-binding protein [Thermomicrobiales bacterium]